LSKEPTILLRSVQVMAGGATFRGFRRCTECSFTDLIPPDHVPYDQQRRYHALSQDIVV
jgi:hypothetical protein